MSNESSWASYTRAFVEFFPPDRAPFRVFPAPKGITGNWVSGLDGPIYVITAWNPGTERPGVDTNRARQKSLEADLRERQLEVWPAVGCDPDSPHREESAATSGLSELDAVALGVHYGQDAIFSWTPEVWTVVSCVDARRHKAGWLLESLPPARGRA
ncbi:MAG: DUF3293 domain-containing protein [Acidimicrobiales bacterium]